MPEILFRAMNAAVGNRDVAVIVLPGDVAVMENKKLMNYLHGMRLNCHA